ncbi:MAG: hypothetical protein KFF50_02920 [Desulfatitalea sp.]|nr:hypothetical protein [Desulfatitalea sp.]
MEALEATETLKALIIENNLPRTDIALFGIKCPYCGKSDRIRQLERPDDLSDKVDSAILQEYAKIWQRLNPSSARLGVCSFCLNPLALNKGSAKTLDQP